MSLNFGNKGKPDNNKIFEDIIAKAYEIIQYRDGDETPERQIEKWNRYHEYLNKIRDSIPATVVSVVVNQYHNRPDYQGSGTYGWYDIKQDKMQYTQAYGDNLPNPPTLDMVIKPYIMINVLAMANEVMQHLPQFRSPVSKNVMLPDLVVSIPLDWFEEQAKKTIKQRMSAIGALKEEKPEGEKQTSHQDPRFVLKNAEELV